MPHQTDSQGLHLQGLVDELQRHNQQLIEERARLQHLNDALAQQNLELSNFAHTLAHDLKNLLAIVLQNNDLLVYYTDAPSARIELMRERIQRAASRSHHASLQIARIVDAVLLLAGINAEEGTPVEALPMEQIVAQAQTRLANRIAQTGAAVTGPVDWPVAVGYAPWVEEIWVNYLENALKYGGNPPQVTLGGEVLGNGFARFWVHDHGAGLSHAAQESLFVEFTQLKQLDQSSDGLGLSIAKHIAEKLGGTVGVDAVAGAGCQFYFTLPAA